MIIDTNGKILTWKMIDLNWFKYKQNNFGYKSLDIIIGGKDKFLYIQITNRPIFWVQLYWDLYHNYGKHLL